MSRSNLSICRRACSLIFIRFFLGHSAIAQKDAVTRTKYRQYSGYFEKIAYYGKHDRYCTVSRYLPDSSLNRIDSYEFVAKSLLGYQYDNSRIAVKQGISEVKYANGRVYLHSNYVMNKLDGPFVVFYEDGSVKRRELYKNGQLKESHCYWPNGTAQILCDPYYQPAQFIGDSKKFQTYLYNKLQPVVNGSTITDVQITLTIDGAGQIANTTLFLNQRPQTPSLSRRAPASARLTPDLELSLRDKVHQLIKDIPETAPNALNWKPAMEDGVPTVGEWTLVAYRTNGFLVVEHP